MIHVRRATESDLDALMRLAEEFALCSPFRELVSLEELRSNVSRMVTAPSDKTLVLVAEVAGAEPRPVGVIVGALTTLWFCAATVAVELAWWVSPEHRTSSAGWRLLSAYEQWAKASGASWVMMSDMPNGATSNMDAAYLKRGYTLVERAYRKEL
jgi:GNAT superfamily N-acetyltransferase